MVAVQFVLILPILTGIAAAKIHGMWSGLVAGALTGLVGFLIVGCFYTLAGRARGREVRALMQAYPSIYRVKEIPADTGVVRAEGVQIQVGDYGWEAEALMPDGKIYLHGLTRKWQVAWYEGFRPDQVENVCEKPRLQYYLPYDWTCIGCKPPSCPYPVRTEPLKTLGFPERIMLPFVQGIRLPKDRV